ncbi:uncharacterized protein LOC121375102 [Gigantopelta aegis]|uniref:uncharacterized protein LOC121375102 n=1 Tax=Gigantopelta aegis TaxID=1735272 RepID=UPI001B88C4B8|nr:uncharacterized protein LOC121375102 [Gigantopelta aegis]
MASDMASRLFAVFFSLSQVLSGISAQIDRNGIAVQQIDHFLIAVNNLTATTAFYSKVFNSRIKEGNPVEIYLGQALVKVFQTNSDFTPRANSPTPGSADVCLVIRTDLTSAAQYLQAINVTVIQGRGGRPGALGTLQSIYFRDPDGNLLEVANYENEQQNADVSRGIQVDRLDHFVITATDQTSTINFYDQIFNVRRTNWEIFLGPQKINVHQLGREFSPHAEPVTVGAADICLLTTTNLADCINFLRNLNISIEQGPVYNSGATGTIRSIYFRDPNQNLIQLANTVGNRPTTNDPQYQGNTPSTRSPAAKVCISGHTIARFIFLIIVLSIF